MAMAIWNRQHWKEKYITIKETKQTIQKQQQQHPAPIISTFIVLWIGIAFSIVAFDFAKKWKKKHKCECGSENSPFISATWKFA